MENLRINSKDVFKTKEALYFFPETINVSLSDNRKNDADCDVIINGFKFPELTNAVIDNYLKYEKNLKINIIIIETSGDPKVIEKIREGSNITKVLVEDMDTMHPVFGKASPGMSLSSAIGQYFVTSPYAFYSHNDMLAVKENFLSAILAKMKEKNIRLASFTNRHFLPFTGCMMIKKEVFDESNYDWMPLVDNDFFFKNKNVQNIYNLFKLSSSPQRFKNIRWIDCGESFIYEEMEKNKQLVFYSLGFNYSYYSDPLYEFFGLGKEELDKVIKSPEFPIIYQGSKINKELFDEKYGSIIKSSESGFWIFKKGKYWRYSFDEDGNMLFIHHGRGTSTKEIKNWLEFASQIND